MASLLVLCISLELALSLSIRVFMTKSTVVVYKPNLLRKRMQRYATQVRKAKLFELVRHGFGGL